MPILYQQSATDSLTSPNYYTLIDKAFLKQAIDFV